MILTNVLLVLMLIILLGIIVLLYRMHKLLQTDGEYNIHEKTLAYSKKKPKVENGLYKRTRKVREVGNS